MKGGFLPLFIAPSVVSARQTVFYKFEKKVTVEAPGQLVRQLIRLCDGTHLIGEVVDVLKGTWDASSVRGLVYELHRQGVLVDCRYMSDAVWGAVENPSFLQVPITDSAVARLVEQARLRHQKGAGKHVYQARGGTFGTLLVRRRSVRSFSEKHIALSSLVDMLWSAYGEVADGRRTTPSAGALYPLLLHVALLRKIGKLPPAVYRVFLGSPGSVALSPISNDTARFVAGFVDPLMLEKAHGVIVVSGSFHITGRKYGNRSLLYVPLEAGHVAQNVHLAAAERGIATVEIGGFMERLIAETVRLPRGYRPLTTVVFGYEKKGGQRNSGGPEPEVNWAVPVAGTYRLPFSMAFARVSPQVGKDWSCGRAVVPRLAHTKAVAEAREWAAVGCLPQRFTRARFADLTTAVDPRDIVSFHPAQYRLAGFPFRPFDEQRKYAWAEGSYELSGARAHVLADCVYFPYDPWTPRYAHANSSGVAAHPDRKQAIRNGTLELVERDSFMIAYLAKLVFPTVSGKTLPREIRRRLRELRKCGFQVWIKDYSLDCALVVFVFAQSEELTSTICAGSAGFDPEVALDHALMEVESSVLCRLANGQHKSIRPAAVQFPDDHGRLYEQKQFFRAADFLVRGQETVPLRDVGRSSAKSWQELLDRFVAKKWQLVTVPLQVSEKLGGNAGLHIIRSIVPGLVPISFGYREEPCGMERIRMAARKFGGSAPSYRDMPKFPHPYT